MEGRWRERSKKLRATATEPQHPADEQDDAVAGEFEIIAERQPAAHEPLSFHSIAQPGSRAQQISVKEPRNGGAIVVNREAKSKKAEKAEKGNEKGIESKTDIEHSLYLYYSRSIVFTVLEESGQAYFSCARMPGFLFFFERDRTYLLACLLRSMQLKTLQSLLQEPSS